jgi:hypothetical protein
MEMVWKALSKYLHLIRLAASANLSFTHVPLVQEIVIQLQNPGDDGELVKHSRLVQQRIYPVRVEALEIIPTSEARARAVSFIG